MSQSFHCPNCGAPLQYSGGDQRTISCLYCHSSVIVPPELRTSSFAEAILTPQEALFNLPDLTNGLRQAAELIRAGKNEDAVSVLQKTLSVDEQEAREITRQMQEGKMVQVTGLENRFTPQTVTLQGANADELFSLIRAGKEDEAIERYRNFTGSDAQTARLAVQGMKMATAFMPAPGMASTDINSNVKSGVKTAVALTGGMGCVSLIITLAILLFTGGIIFWALVSDNGPLEGWWLKTNPFARERVVLAFGKQGIGNGTFQDPRHIAVDSEGNIYVANYQDGRIQRFDSQGNFLNLWTVQSAGNPNRKPIIQSMEISRSGILYVAYEGKIHRIDVPSGEVLTPIEQPGVYFENIRVRADGKLAATANNDDLILLDANGVPEWTVKNAIEAVAEESELSVSLAVDGLGNFYLTGAFTDSVYKFSPTGKYLNRWGSAGDGNGLFRALNALAVDSQGRVYVSDIHGIQVFDANGLYQRTIKFPGVAFGLTINDQDQLFIITNTPEVMQFNLR